VKFSGFIRRVLSIEGRNPTAGQINFANEVSATSQEFLEEVNINTIMSRYINRGILPSGNPRRPLYGDFMSVGDFMEAQNRFITAREQFMALPASLRQKLNNNPAEFLVWVTDPSNKDEATRLGLLQAAQTVVTGPNPSSALSAPPGVPPAPHSGTTAPTPS